MAEKRSDNFMNFGPEWLQNLSQPTQESNTSSNSNSKPRPATSTKCQLAEYRYGREEMLALFDANAVAPDYLVKHEELFVANTQLPIALQSDIDDMRRYHQDPRNPGSASANRGIRENLYRQDSRGRPPRNFYTTPDPNFARSRSTSSNFRYFPERHGPNNPPAGDVSAYRPMTGRARTTYWRRDGPTNEMEPWRSSDNNYRQRPRTSWRDEDDKFGDNERRPQIRRIRKANAEEDPGDAPSLPEWAENDNMAYSGSFDASGAYTESSTGDTREEEYKREEKIQSFDNHLADEIPPESPVEKLSKGNEDVFADPEPLPKKTEPEISNPPVPETKMEEMLKAEEPSPPAFYYDVNQVAPQDHSPESAKPKDVVNKFLDPKPFNAPNEIEESSQQNGCKGMADNINSLLNWVLDETGPEDANKALQSNFPLDQRDLASREALALNLERQREAMMGMERGNMVSDLDNFMALNFKKALDIERRMEMDLLARSARDAKETAFNASLHGQQGIDLPNMYPSDLDEYNTANNLKMPKFMPLASHLSPFGQVPASMPLNTNMLPLSFQQLPSEQPWSAEEGLLGGMPALWNERQLEIVKQMALQNQQDLLQNRQMNQQRLVVPPQLPPEPQTMLPETNNLNFANYRHPRQPSPMPSVWEEILQLQKASRQQQQQQQQPSYGDMYNFYLHNNTIPSRTEPLLVEDVYRNSLNYQMQNQLLTSMDAGLPANVNPVGRNDLLQLLQRQQQQQLQQPQQQVFVPPQQPDINLLTQQFSMETPSHNFLNMPPPQLPQPIPMPERRISQMNPVTPNVPTSPNAPPTTTTAPATVDPPTPQVAPVVEEQVVKQQDVSNFEVVKKKDKKAKKKTENESEKSESGKKKGKAAAAASSSKTANQQQLQQQLIQQQLQQQQQQQQLQHERNLLQMEIQLREQAQKAGPIIGAKPKASRPAPWLVQPLKDTATNTQQMSLTQIQKMEKEQQRKAQSLHKAQQAISEQQAIQKEKEAVPWVHFVPPPEKQKLSLLDIQYEERKQHMQPFNSAPAPVPSSYASEGIDSKLMKIGGIWGPPETSNSVWNFSNTQVPQPPTHTATVPQKHQQKPAAEEPKKPPPPAAALPHEDNSDELDAWAKDFLKNYEHKLDIEAFLSFIRNIESPYEVKEYIKFYLGETKDTMDYCEEYIEKRLEINRRKNFVIPADDLSAPAAAINPAMNMDSQEAKGKNKKTKKNKMSKIDSRILGFNVTAAADRFNIGDIDSIEKP